MKSLRVMEINSGFATVSHFGVAFGASIMFLFSHCPVAFMFSNHAEMWFNGTHNASINGNQHTFLSEFGRLWMMPDRKPA
jgi:hypothetical protein